MKIFLSYRRDDAAGQAGRLRDALVARYGAASVFHDVSTIRPGEDFVTAVTTAVDACDVMLVVIGPRWATALQAHEREDEPEDYVRLEVATALGRGKRMIPVTVAGAMLPPASALPDEMDPMLTRQSFELRDEYWSPDVEALMSRLGAQARPARDASSRAMVKEQLAVAAGLLMTPRGVLASGGVLIAVIALALWQPWSAGGAGEGSSDVLPSCFPPLENDAGWTPFALVQDPTAADDELMYETLASGYREVQPGRWLLQARVRATNATNEEQYHDYYVYRGIVVDRILYDLSCFSAVFGTDLLDPGLASEALIGIQLLAEPSGQIEVATDAGPRIVITAPE